MKTVQTILEKEEQHTTCTCANVQESVIEAWLVRDTSEEEFQESRHPCKIPGAWRHVAKQMG